MHTLAGTNCTVFSAHNLAGDHNDAHLIVAAVMFAESQHMYIACFMMLHGVRAVAQLTGEMINSLEASLKLVTVTQTAG